MNKETEIKLNCAFSEIDKQVSEAKEGLLGEVCSLCHYPFNSDQDSLDTICENCKIPDLLKSYVLLERTKAIAEVMRITAEEMISLRNNRRSFYDSTENHPDGDRAF